MDLLTDCVDRLQRLRSPSDLAFTRSGDALIATVTPELRREGQARELISRVQRMRKEAGLAVSDRIVLSVSGDSELKAVIDEHRAWIADEVLAKFAGRGIGGAEPDGEA